MFVGTCLVVSGVNSAGYRPEHTETRQRQEGQEEGQKERQEEEEEASRLLFGERLQLKQLKQRQQLEREGRQ
jgi:hypothetical protein